MFAFLQNVKKNRKQGGLMTTNVVKFNIVVQETCIQILHEAFFEYAQNWQELNVITRK
jgi:hypothetical protein